MIALQEEKAGKGMDKKEQLMQGLCDAGCSMEEAERIGRLYEAGSYGEALHQMKVQRCTQMHESQRQPLLPPCTI